MELEHKRRLCLASDMSGAAILQGNLEKRKEEIKALSDVSWVGEQNFKYFAIGWEDRSSFHSITSPGATSGQDPRSSLGTYYCRVACRAYAVISTGRRYGYEVRSSTSPETVTAGAVGHP